MRPNRRRHTPLAGHRREGSRLRPLWASLPVTALNGIRDLAPEFLWLDAIVTGHAIGQHLRLMDAVLTALRDVDPDRPGIRVGLISDLAVGAEEESRVVARLSSGTRAAAFPSGFREAMTLFADFPGRYLLADLTADPNVDAFSWLRNAFLRVVDRESDHGAYLNALTFRNAIVSGKITIDKQMHEMLTPAIKVYPGGTDSQRHLVESVARAQLNTLYGMHPADRKWPQAFWHRHQELACRRSVA